MSAATMTTTTTTTHAASSSRTRNYHNGNHYIELDSQVKQVPPVIVFFSFLDATSKDWALRYNVVNTIRRNVPKGVEISRYHTATPYPNDFGRDLNHAWAAAKSFHVDDKIIRPLFEAVQGDTSISDVQGVKAVFDYIGLPPLRLDKEYNKASVIKEAEWMEECREKMGITNVPAIVVDGKYLIKTDALGEEIDAEKIADVVKELLQLQR